MENTKQTILLVDDDEALRTVIARQVEQCGFDVVQVSNGERAFESLQNGKFHGLVTDFQMGAGMDGVDLLEKLTKHGLLPKRAVLASGHADPARERIALLQLRANVLDKPFPMEALLRALTENE